MPALSPPPSGPQGPLRELQRRVESLLDADALLPADGRALLEMLEGAEQCIRNDDASTARGLLQGFILLLAALMESGILDAADGSAGIEAARRIFSAPAA